MGFMFQGCNMLESHPYDVNVKGDKHITEDNITRIESSLSGKDSFIFAMISDTQRGYDAVSYTHLRAHET